MWGFDVGSEPSVDDAGGIGPADADEPDGQPWPTVR